MISRWVAALLGVLAFGFAGPALAQVPMMGNLPSFDTAPPAPPPGAAPAAPMAAPMAAPPGARGGAMPPQQGGEPPPCFRDFMPLRQEAEKRGGLIKAASERKAPRAEFCKLFRSLVVAQAKMLNYVVENQAACAIPDEIIKQIKAGHEHTQKTRDQACAAGPAAGPAGPPPGPKLSDELGVGGIARPGTTPGRGTFDTLTGNALAR